MLTVYLVCVSHCRGGRILVVSVVVVDQRWIFFHIYNNKHEASSDCKCEPPSVVVFYFTG